MNEAEKILFEYLKKYHPSELEVAEIYKGSVFTVLSDEDATHATLGFPSIPGLGDFAFTTAAFVLGTVAGEIVKDGYQVSKEKIKEYLVARKQTLEEKAGEEVVRQITEVASWDI